MKLDHSLLRAILLAVERADEGASDFIYPEVKGHSAREISYHVRTLSEAGFITAFALPDRNPSAPDHWSAQHMLFSGHEYLNAIRDDTVWRVTLERMAKVGGGVTVEIVKAIASAVLKQVLGLPG